MPRIVSYSRRPQSGQITCYLNRTYHVLATRGDSLLDKFWHLRYVFARREGRFSPLTL